MIFLESGLADDHSEYCARDLARFVLLDVYLKGEGELLLHCWLEVLGLDDLRTGSM